jgi:hypothetical protein
LGSSLTGKTPRQVVAAGDRDRERTLTEVRRRGVRGGVIGTHRSMASGYLTPSLVLSAVIVPLLLAATVVVALGPITDVWRQTLDLLRRALDLPGEVVSRTVSLGGILSFAMPYLSTPANVPGVRENVIVGAVCVLALAVSFALPKRFLPLAYYLRFGTLVQLTTFLYFAIRPDSFPYALPPYLLSLMDLGTAILVVVPLVYGLTLFPFDIALWRKVLLTAMTVLHLAVLLPVQMVLHAYAIHHLSLLVMPPLFFLWGILPHIFVFVSFYGWGMSWPSARSERVVGGRGGR